MNVNFLTPTIAVVVGKCHLLDIVVWSTYFSGDRSVSTPATLAQQRSSLGSPQGMLTGNPRLANILTILIRWMLLWNPVTIVAHLWLIDTLFPALAIDGFWLCVQSFWFVLHAGLIFSH